MPFMNQNHVKSNAVCTQPLMAPIAVESACYDNRLSYMNSMQDRCEKKKQQTTEIIYQLKTRCKSFVA